MSKAYLVPHDFSTINISYFNDVFNTAGSVFSAGQAQSGEYITLTATGGSTVTVPAIFSGLDLTFIVANTGAHTITCPSGTIFGAINFPYAGTSGNLSAAASTSISTTLGSCVGDRFKLTSDGTNCYLSGTVSKYNSVKIL